MMPPSEVLRVLALARFTAMETAINLHTASMRDYLPNVTRAHLVGAASWNDTQAEALRIAAGLIESGYSPPALAAVQLEPLLTALHNALAGLVAACDGVEENGANAGAGQLLTALSFARATLANAKEVL